MEDKIKQILQEYYLRDLSVDDATQQRLGLFAVSKYEGNELRILFYNFYRWLDGLSESEYDKMSLTDKCEKYFFKIIK